MDIVWSKAALFEPPKVLGKTLRGFSPFHALTLGAVQSCFMCGGDYSTGDLILAVHVCSMGWDDRFTLVSDMPAIQAWGKSVTLDQFTEALGVFETYLAESFDTPQFWKGSGESLRANWIYHLATFGMRELKMTEAEAWDCPIARLVCYRACVSECDGDKSLMTDDEKKGLEILKAYEEKEKANGAS